MSRFMPKRIAVDTAALVFGLLAIAGASCESGGGGDRVQPGPAPQSGPARESEETIAPPGPDRIAGRADPSAVSVRLKVRVSRTGATEIIDAVELPGILKREHS